ncbi:MAG TPA: hypothetical protein VGN63_21755 [Flavisolibacter sp.]|jgi:hypothetical protein|nr:hypothetical protein [Flavisolibacter sp.]
MNTKQILLENILITPGIAETIDKINFTRLEEFVTELFSVFVNNRGPEAVKYDLNYDVQTPTDAFISNMVEVGSVQLLQENNLLHDEQFIDALYIIISAINIVVAEFLRTYTIADVVSYRYFDADPQYVILERAVEQVEQIHNQSGFTIDHSGFQVADPFIGSLVY